VKRTPWEELHVYRLMRGRDRRAMAMHKIWGVKIVSSQLRMWQRQAERERGSKRVSVMVKHEYPSFPDHDLPRLKAEAA
jgi:hypothetical protein